MEWINSLIPLVGVLIGWGLSEFSKVWLDKKQDRRKLKRLLFFLMELRFHIGRELRFETEIIDYINKAKEKVKQDITEVEIENFKPFIKQAISNNLIDEGRIDFLEANIDEIIIELSEIYPVFAYELSGQFKVKDRLNRTNQYLNEVEEYIQQMPFDFKAWLQPKVTEKLLSQLDENLLRIAKTIGRKTLRNIESKLYHEDTPNNVEFDNFMEEYFEKIKAN